MFVTLLNEWLKRRKNTRRCSDKPRVSPWKPFTLSPLALGGLIVFTALLLAVVEASRQISEQKGGVLFADNLDDLPGTQTFAYLYLPTMIAIMYSIVWAWVDLDVKRMEPYYQLSKAEGTMASESLLLSYPHDFLPFVPVKAARRRYLPKPPISGAQGLQFTDIGLLSIPAQSCSYCFGVSHHFRMQ